MLDQATYTPRLKTLKVAEPAGRSAGVKVPDVKALVEKLGLAKPT